MESIFMRPAANTRIKKRGPEGTHPMLALRGRGLLLLPLSLCL